MKQTACIFCILLLVQTSCATNREIQYSDYPDTYKQQASGFSYNRLPYLQSPAPRVPVSIAEPRLILPERIVDKGLEILRADTPMPGMAKMILPALPVMEPTREYPEPMKKQIEETEYNQIPMNETGKEPSGEAKESENSPAVSEPETVKAPTTAPTKTYPDSDIPVMELTLTLSDENTTEISLPDRGWIFLESDSDMAFRSRRSSEEQETFLFHIPDPVDTRAIFQRQDLDNGLLNYQALDITFIPASEDLPSASEIVYAFACSGRWPGR